jgi:thioesterase domain-containing protein/acyl carrier protein
MVTYQLQICFPQDVAFAATKSPLRKPMSASAISYRHSSSSEAALLLCPPLSASSVQARLADIWCRVLDRAKVRHDDSFLEVGGDSLAAVQMLMEVKKEFGLQIPMSAMLEAPTLALLADMIENEFTGSFSHLVPLQPYGTNPPFFCVHGVGGNVLCFSELARHFAPDYPFYGIQGENPERPLQFSTVEQMAARYIGEIRKIQPTGPYYIGGFSFGGSVALEIAKQLLTCGERIGLLAILDHTPPPDRYQPEPWSLPVFVGFFVNALRWFVEDIWRKPHRQKFHIMKRKCQMAIQQIRRWFSGSRSAKTDVEDVFGASGLPDQFRRQIEVHYQAMRNYAPTYFPGSVTVLRAQVRPLFRFHKPDLGWKKLAGNGLTIINLPGNHETMLREPNVSILASILTHCLRKACVQSGAEFGSFQVGHRRT